MCCSLQPSGELLASSHESHGLIHCVPTISSAQCAPGFLPEWNQDVPGAERVLGGSHTAPGWEALGGLADQAHSSSSAVTARTERRRLPTPAGQP